MGGEEMEYVRTDPETKAHLFRCQAGGCPLKTGGTKAITHCDSEIWGAARDESSGAGAVAQVLVRMEAAVPATDEH